MSVDDPYETLQVARNASIEVIRAAYRSLSKQFHPDRDSSKQAAEQFERIQTAWEILSDDSRRSEYDNRSGRGSDHRRACSNVSDPIIMKLDGNSSFLTLSEHLRRGGKALAGCDLTSLRLSNVSLRGANLSQARLDGSSFLNCDFRDADISGGSAQKCDFTESRFSGAHIVDTDFTGSDLRNAEFFEAGAVLASSNCNTQVRFQSYDPLKRVVDQAANTRKTMLRKVRFEKTDLRGAKFTAPPAECSQTETTTSSWGMDKNVPMYLRQEFRNCQLTECDFSSANLDSISLSGLNLQGCRFAGANLHGVDLQKANIEGVDFSSCNLVNANLHAVAYSGETQFPDGYPIPADAVDREQQRLQERQRESLDENAAWAFFLIMLFFIIIVFLFMALS